MRNERLIEIKQGKGTSEAHPLLSPNDEFASYEMYEAVLGTPGRRGPDRSHHGSYARQALKDGLAMQDTRGFNPYKFGLAAALRLAQLRQPVPSGQFLRPARRRGRDGRAALRRRPHRRHHGRAPGKSRRIDRRVGRGKHPRFDLGRACIARKPLASAARTSRCASSAAGTTTPDIAECRRLGEAILRGRRADGRRSACHARRRQRNGADVCRLGGEGPDLGQPGSHSDRQGLDEERARASRRFSTWPGPATASLTSGPAVVPAIQSTVNIEKATYENSVGATELKTVWSDPEFDSSLHAFYYARVLEIPTPRWTLIQAVKAGIPPPDIVPSRGRNAPGVRRSGTRRPPRRGRTRRPE